MKKNLKKLEMYKIYCTGCGLCHSGRGIDMTKSNAGFWRPNLDKDTVEQFCTKVCPASGKHLKSTEVWGNMVSACYGCATDQELRWRASSGGVLSAIAISLLESSAVDGIIQMKQAKESAINNEVTVSRSIKEVMECCGSRYCLSSPLMEIDKLFRDDEKYCFIGKPCDVAALRNLMDIDNRLKHRIPYLLSFFCAGIPSEAANRKLLNALRVKETEIDSLSYRGNGWPGHVTANRKNGQQVTLSYEEAWGKILGRDINKICKFCMDGTGEAADIACGDAWYTLENGTPDFGEHEGRNIIFSRTAKGQETVLEAVRRGYLYTDNCFKMSDMDNLKKIQSYQFIRKTTMLYKMMGMKICGKLTPDYKFPIMWEYAKKVPFHVGLRIFAGTIKRICKGRL